MFRLLTLAVLVAPTPARTLNAQTPQRAELWAFTGPWDPLSTASLRSNAAKLDAVVTGWIGLDSVTARPLLPSPFPDGFSSRVGWGTPRRLAIVTSWHGDRFHPSTIRRLASDRALLAATASSIAAHAAAMRYRGLVLDFEALERSDLDALVRVVRAIADSARARGVRPVSVAIPAMDTAAYPGKPLLAVADLVLPMLYDQHWATSAPGPIADPVWVRSALAIRLAEIGPSRLVAGLPTYGYRWRQGRETESISFAEARRISARAGVPMTRDAASKTLRASRPGLWELWVSDAALVRTLMRESEAAGVRRFALWRLGQEDPGIWKVVR